MQSNTARLLKEAEQIFTENISPFWLSKMVDDEHGGFYGRITGEGEIFPDAPKGAVLNARILWTFAAAYRIFGEESYLIAARRAKEYLLKHFYDITDGGIYWMLDYTGKPLETKKQIYAQGFAIYGLSEYYRATSDNVALECAKAIFFDIEKHSFDKLGNGYLEAFTENWQPIADMRLSEKDENVEKTMNTHLHILEPYTNLYRVWKNEKLKHQLQNLIELFLDKIINPDNYHLNLFFDMDWTDKSEIISYGHDIEASWLLYEAALVLGDEKILKRVKELIPHIIEASLEGFQPDNSMIYEKEENSGDEDRDRHWWVQAETVVGLLNHYQLYNDINSLNKAIACFDYIKNNLQDKENGDWFWSIRSDGTVNRSDDKAGIWKCPYHNSRMCFEIMERFGRE